MELDKIDNLELLELYKEVDNFCDFLEKNVEQARKEMDDENE